MITINNKFELSLSRDGYTVTIYLNKDYVYYSYKGNPIYHGKLSEVTPEPLKKWLIQYNTCEISVKLSNITNESDPEWELSIKGNAVELCYNITTHEYSAYDTEECTLYPREAEHYSDVVVIGNLLDQIQSDD